MAKNLNDILGKLQGVKASKIVPGSTGVLPGVDYAPKMPDVGREVAQHETEKHDDRVGNDEKVYGGSTKEARMARHGYQKPADIKAYQKANEEVESVDEKYMGFEKTEKALAAKGAKDPGALAAWIGRKKYGKEKFQKAAAAGKKLKEAKKDKDEGEYDYEGDMAINQLKSICRNAEELMEILKPDTNLPEWVQSKITLAQDYVQAASDYMKSEMSEAKMCESCGNSPCTCDKDDMPKGKGKKLLLDKEKIDERHMTASEKAREEALKKKYDDSEMKANMVGRYGKEKGERIYFAYIRKKAMKEQAAPADTAIQTPSTLVADTGRV